ncbi:uncharacterized protein L3040_008880 [Drepanopeziza brunnea f. sp. 'multigermtubi']|uniref:uncharacterized protein n=1 Tax=Drepanopeziza brunnea f. sp. 'multigermtubi' TaxID=698441 RepID=UPI00239210AC|nr:hypothetical protein L3040_008880 [Drepanopeziza brunnea f. sp. 'multigermtubi']
MEGLQMAQIIADLQALQNADPAAAHALLTPMNPKPAPVNSTGTGASTPQSRRDSGAQGPKYDRMGRTVVAPGKPPPNFTREESGASTGSSVGIGSATPGGGAGAEMDEDLKRAKTLLELFEMRGKFKHMGDTGLLRAKQRVDDVVARHARSELDYREKEARTRHLRVNR